LAVVIKVNFPALPQSDAMLKIGFIDNLPVFYDGVVNNRFVSIMHIPISHKFKFIFFIYAPKVKPLE
jgi:hypothetical protein